MKISSNWLRTLIKTDISNQEISEKLTAAGLEVEGTENFESIEGGLKGLVVGHIVECGKHPDADRLSLTKVDIGSGELLSIVCGAPNVAQNQKVIVATIGTKLYPSSGEPFEIKKSKIRGALSEGMICAEDEIGMGNSHAGIMVLPDSTIIGTAAAEYFKLENDTVFEIGLTPNRSDAASHLGVARDLAAILNTEARNQEIKPEIPGLHELADASNKTCINIQIENAEACPRYSAIVIEGIKVAESPDWLKNRLNAIGVRPINNIVDITNFVLHELGQPLHAFDTAKIKGKKVIVRNAKPGETFVSLDGVERKLIASDLMICNEKEAMCLAGIFGGADSGVTEKTTSIFLESAYFDASSIRKSAKHHGLKTDASFRFERGTDPEMTITALTRAANLIFELAGGNLSMAVTDSYPTKLEPYKVGFSYLNCTELIGKEIDRHLIKDIILNLGIEIDNEGSDALLLKVPRYKTDVTREADVIEEVMRIYGYNHVEVSKHISYTALNEAKNYSVELENRLGSLLEGFGFNEIMSLSLSKEAYYNESNNTVKVLNPLSNDLNVMRADMLFSGLEAIAYNINRKSSHLKFFEIGKTYQKNESDYSERKQLTLFLSGDLFSENPYKLNHSADFAALKNVIDQILTKSGIHQAKSSESEYEHFDFGMSYQSGKKNLVDFGMVSSKLLKKFGIPQTVLYATFDWEVLVKEFSKQKIQFVEIAKFPSVRRDLALLIDKQIKYQQIEELAFTTERKFLKEVNLFDIYQDEKLGGKKSYGVRFTLLNHEATLTDKQIDGVMEKLISNYKEKLGAELR